MSFSYDEPMALAMLQGLLGRTTWQLEDFRKDIRILKRDALWCEFSLADKICSATHWGTVSFRRVNSTVTARVIDRDVEFTDAALAFLLEALGAQPIPDAEFEDDPAWWDADLTIPHYRFA